MRNDFLRMSIGMILLSALIYCISYAALLVLVGFL
jgi:hypothetical protein